MKRHQPKGSTTGPSVLRHLYTTGGIIDDNKRLLASLPRIPSRQALQNPEHPCPFRTSTYPAKDTLAFSRVTTPRLRPRQGYFISDNPAAIHFVTVFIPFSVFRTETQENNIEP